MEPLPLSKPWIAYHQAASQATLRLFCFPYAGGCASIFRPWIGQLPSEVEVCPIQLPGRENRWKEAPLSNLSELIQEMLQFLPPHLDKPFAFFGHSMGALISFELARALRQLRYPVPLHLFVSAFRAPQLPRVRPPIHQLAQPSFIDALRQFNGTPEEILQNEEVLDLMLPLLRADFALCETYAYQPSSRLNCSISVFGGLDDVHISRSDLLAWQDQTARAFTLRMFPGDHFFLRESQILLLDAVSLELIRYVDQLKEGSRSC